MDKDIFCKIIARELPADIVAEGESWLAFKDIHPQAPIHVLIAPKEHMDGLNGDNKQAFGDLLAAAGEVARLLEVSENGFRLIINQGRDAGQLVPHLHLHFLAGKKLGPKIV